MGWGGEDVQFYAKYFGIKFKSHVRHEFWVRTTMAPLPSVVHFPSKYVSIRIAREAEIS